jgi:hypothetical protein
MQTHSLDTLIASDFSFDIYQAFIEFWHRSKKHQSQDLEEQVAVEPLEVAQIVLDETIWFSLDPVALV